MLDAPIINVFTEELWKIENTIPASSIQLLRLHRQAIKAKQALQDGVQQILLPLPQENKIMFLRNCLEQMERDRSFYQECPWWLEECLRGKPNSYWLGELGEVGRFAGVSRQEISEAAYHIAVGISSRRKLEQESIESWRTSFAIVNKMKSFIHNELPELLQQYKENGEEFPYTNVEYDDESYDNTRYCTCIIAGKTLDSAIYSLASHLTFIEDPKAGFTAGPSFRWQSRIETTVTDLIEGLADEEKEGYAPAIEWRNMLMIARDKMYESLFWGSDTSTISNPAVSPTTILQWQGSKTELAELGYALLESGLIDGPREASLKALADFFGQDLGNPAKHLQTLQKRKWDPSDKEPVTPLIDKLGAALKNLLKIKAVSPTKK